MVLGTGMAVAEHFKSSLYPFHLGTTVLLGYAGVWAVVINILVAVVLTWIFKAMKLSNGQDETNQSDYQVRQEASGS